jgi:hypothetical protein
MKPHPHAQCSKHDRTAQVVPPPWAPFVLNSSEVRKLLTGCPCEDPTSSDFDPFMQEVRGHLHDIEDAYKAWGETPLLGLRKVRGVPLDALLDSVVYARSLREVPLRELLDADDPRQGDRG